jgi:hypothetical protein
MVAMAMTVSDRRNFAREESAHGLSDVHAAIPGQRVDQQARFFADDKSALITSAIDPIAMFRQAPDYYAFNVSVSRPIYSVPVGD